MQCRRTLLLLHLALHRSPQVVKKGGELLLSEAARGGGGLLGSTFVDRNWEQFFEDEVGSGHHGMLDPARMPQGPSVRCCAREA